VTAAFSVCFCGDSDETVFFIMITFLEQQTYMKHVVEILCY
jgi:hypothetical protein